MPENIPHDIAYITRTELDDRPFSPTKPSLHGTEAVCGRPDRAARQAKYLT